MASRGKAVGFDPLKKLSWVAETEVEAVKALVRNRERIFAKHRRMANPSLEAQSRQVVEKLCEGRGSKLRSPRDRYADFCSAVNIPGFPISMSTIALFTFAKCAHRDGHYHQGSMILKRFRRATWGLWSNMHGIDDLEDADLVEAALSAFNREREGIRILSTRDTNSRPNVSESRRGTSSMTDSGEESDSSESDSGSNSSSDGIAYRRAPSASSDSLERSTAAGVHTRPEHGASSSRIKQLDVPGLPQPGDRFATADSLLIASHRAVVPLYGFNPVQGDENGSVVIKCGRSHNNYRKAPSGRCKWKIGTTRDNLTRELVVDRALSNLVHNHGPSNNIVRCPHWRPPVHNPIIRKALGLRPKEKVTQSSVSSSLDEAPRPKKAKHCPPNEATTRTSSLPQSASSMQPPPVPNRSPPTAHASSTSASYHTPVYSAPSRRSPPLDLSASCEFSRQLEAFLLALHPSLPSLTSALLDYGLDSINEIANFCSLSPPVLKRALQALKAQDRTGAVSTVHLKLFEKKITEASLGESGV